jgi:hypothetical protein
MAQIGPIGTNASIAHKMPALANPRHERFVRYYMKTNNASAAYLKAGYRPKDRASLDPAASKLTRHHKVQSRIREIRRQMTQRTRITIESLLHDLAEDRALARETKQVSAAIAATQLSAKLVGLLIDRKESGQPGDFSDLTSADEILARVRADLGDDMADAITAALAKQADTPADGSVEPGPAVGDLVELDAERDDGATLN